MATVTTMRLARPEVGGLPLLTSRAAAAAVLLGALLMAVPGTAVQAQSGDGRSGLRVQSRFSLTQTATDNLTLAPSASRDAALITTLAPGLSLLSPTGRLRGSLDYSLNGLIYTKTDRKDQIQHQLSAQATLEAVEHAFFIDGRASISQQSISAFGVQSADNALVNANRTEVASLSLSPYLKGRLGSVAELELRGSAAESRAKDSITGDVSTRAASLRVNGLSNQSLLNWSLALSASRADPRGGRETRNDSAIATAHLRPDVDWRIGLSAGAERNNLTSTAQRSDATYGLNLAWTPSPRTTASFDWQRHGYGNTHSLSLQHRMARTVWRVSDSKSVNTGGVQASSGTQNNYELLFLQFAGIEPDPIKRDQLVRSFLQSNGLDAGAIATSGFLTGAASLSRRQEASTAWNGQRFTATLTLSRTRSQRLDALSQLSDDLAAAGVVEQRGFLLNLSHRLTPTASLSMALSQQRSLGSRADQDTELNSLSLNWSGRLGAHSTVQFGLRHSDFDSRLRPYRENAVFANFIRQF